MAIDKYHQSVSLVLKVAYLYYIENKPQNEISSMLGVSVTTVSRLLNKAREDKIVEFVIRDPYIECIRLEEQLKNRFHLKDIIIAPVISNDDGSESEMAVENAKKLVAMEGARYLQRVIKESDILGVTWGSTVYHMINYLNPSQKVNAKFVTLHGSIACCENELDVRTLVSRMAKAFFGENYYLLTDALMSSKEASWIMKEEKNNQRVFNMFEHVTISVSGIGSFYPTEESVLASPDFMPTEDLEKLKQENVSGDIALRFFDHDGQECNTTLKERMISISMEAFKKIDRKISLVSGVSKANAVLSALKGGLVDVLILDSNLAEALLKLSDDML